MSRILKKNDMRKYNEAFYDFLEKNSAGIKDADIGKFACHKLQMNPKFFVNMKEVYNLLIKEDKQSFWQYIQTLYTMHFKSDAGDVINNLATKSDGKGTNERKCLKDIMSKVSAIIPSGDMKNPQEALTKIGSTGDFTSMINDIVNKLSSGSLEIPELLGVIGSQMRSLKMDGKS